MTVAYTEGHLHSVRRQVHNPVSEPWRSRRSYFINIYELHTEDIAGCRWNNHGWMVILHLNEVRSVYRPFVVTTKLSSIVSMKKKKKKKKQTVLVAATHGIIHRRSDDDTQGKQAKKKGSIYVIEDTTRRRERERQRGKAKKKYEWNSMLASMEAVRLRRIFNSSLLLCLFFFPFPLVHDCIT